MPTLTVATARDAAIADAKSLPQLISNLQTADPALATQLESKPLLASKTIYGTALASLIGLAAAKYGIGFDTGTDQLIAGCIVLGVTTVASAVLRMMTKQPIAGVVSAPVTSANPTT